MTEKELKEIEEVKNRLDFLYSRADEVKAELKDITDEIFELELHLILRKM